MKYIEQIYPGGFYHLYNHSNGRVNIFREAANYEFFMGRYKKYIAPMVNTYAWCLMPNHFHFLVRVKNEDEILKEYEKKLSQKKNKKKIQNLQGFVGKSTTINKEPNLEGLEDIISKFLSQQFSNFFNSYTKSYHKFYNTRGNLFNHRFKRKPITNEEYLLRLILYIHNNPVHHGFVENIADWPYSSYHSYLSSDKSLLYQNALTDLFVSAENFIYMHTRESLLCGDITLEE